MEILFSHPAVWCAAVLVFAGLFTLFRNFKSRLGILSGTAHLSEGILFSLYFLEEKTDTPLALTIIGLSFLTKYILIILYLHISKIKKSSKEEKKWFKLILLSELAALSLLMLTFVFFNSQSIILILFPIILTISLIRWLATVWHQFISYKVLTAQLIASLVVIFSLLNFTESSGYEELLLGIILTGALASLAYLLVRSVINEVQKKRHVQKVVRDIYKANKRLKQIDKAKSEFISIASHQLRTPLTSVKGFTSLILEDAFGKVTPKQRKNIEKIFINNEKLILLVEDMLNASRLEAGRLEYEFLKVDIVEIVESVVQNLKLQAKNKKLYLRFKKPKVKVPLILGDQRKITEVLGNLVDNAIKYTKKGGIEISIQRSKKVLKIKVKDTGIGLTQKEKKLIFEKFKKGLVLSSLKSDGTGIGLYISQRFTEAHGGKLYAKSPGKDKGSTFIIELPIKEK